MQIAKDTRLDVNRVILLNRKIRPSSISFRMLSSFYDKMEAEQIIEDFSSKICSKNPRKDAHRYILHLQSIGLVEKESAKKCKITKKGRWYVIAAKLGIPLFSLILLANVYVFQKNMKKRNKPDFYVVGFFFEKIRNFMTHHYRIHGELIRKNYVTKYANQSIRIPDSVFERLKEFDADFSDIARWYLNVDDQIHTVLLSDKLLVANKATV